MMSKVVYGGKDYVEYDKGVRQCGLAFFSGYDDDDNPIYLEICYTDDTECVLGADFTESHRKAVEEVAEDYDLTIAG